MSRGYKNLNPGNLIKSSFKFVGEIDSLDPHFRQFVSMPYGFRAMLKVLQTYIKSGDNTLEKIINRYAPPFENPTDAYIHFVSEHTGISPDRIISVEDKQTIVPVAFAMATMENGSAPSLNDVLNGWDLLKTFKMPDPGSSASVPPPLPGDKKKTNNLTIPILLLGSAIAVTSFIYVKRKQIYH